MDPISLYLFSALKEWRLKGATSGFQKKSLRGGRFQDFVNPKNRLRQ